MTKKNPLDPAEQFAKAMSGRRVCRACTPYVRARMMRWSDGAHTRCDDIECGCHCQDEARKS